MLKKIKKIVWVLLVLLGISLGLMLIIGEFAIAMMLAYIIIGGAVFLIIMGFLSYFLS